MNSVLSCRRVIKVFPYGVLKYICIAAMEKLIFLMVDPIQLPATDLTPGLASDEKACSYLGLQDIRSRTTYRELISEEKDFLLMINPSAN